MQLFAAFRLLSSSRHPTIHTLKAAYQAMVYLNYTRSEIFSSVNGFLLFVLNATQTEASTMAVSVMYGIPQFSF